MSLKILHLGCFYLPYVGGSSMRISQILEALVLETDIIPFVITEQPKQDGSYSNNDELENINGVLVHRVRNILETIKAIRRIVHRHEIDIVHAHGPRPALLLSVLCKRKMMVVEHHGLHDLSFIKRQLAKYAMNRAKAVILLSEASRKRVRDYFNIFVVNSSTETAKKEPFTVGYIGTFHEWQGVHTLIKSLPQVLRKCNKIQYILIGEGPCFKDIQGYIKKHNLFPNVRLLGVVPHDRIKSYMQKMNVIIIPRPSTPATETIVPLKIFEAMAARKPLIISRVGGLLEILTENENCLAFTPGNSEDLSNKIMILKNDPNLGLALARKSYELVQKQPDWKQVALSMANVYNSVSC